MAIYDGYVRRDRVTAGVGIKRKQAEKIFGIALEQSEGVAGSILEIGPGDGYIAELSRATNQKYLAIEGSASVAKKIRDAGFEVYESYVPPLPSTVPEGKFRCCFLLHVLEHMESPVAAATLVSELSSRLLPGGVLVIACPDYTRWGHYFYDCDYTHSYPVTRRRIAQLFRDQGLEFSFHTVYCGKTFGYHSVPISWIAKLMYWPMLDDLIGSKKFNDIWNRGFLTFLPNLLSVAKRIK